ncbi:MULTISPECIES: hypothetical protein [Rhodococcus]|jgi:hypothetical protein|uniref:DUF4386 family protein n=1 Tax=Rhodococcus jostii TaxID=132919 RepID=A0ABU4CCG9_RHOJO|nr:MULTISPECIES: hypothetical protein [Rhodococcus]MDI9953678.1 hypothetical protein [Rhodococcus sp. IEGM 1305]MDI9979876.1 hypothetical protein [Rhodococcus sp. IEGM 1307]MDV6281236.1 hypothetical protein [Rhodococcus jostii]
MTVSDRIESRTGVARICAAALFALAGVLFVVYPLVRPYAAGGAPDGRAEFASPSWLVAHLAAVGGFIAFGLALVALSGLLKGTGGERAAVVAVAASWIGTGLTLPYYGAETFALHALGGSDLDENAVTTLTESVRMGAAQATLFATGLLLVAVGAAAAAVAIARSRLLAGWAGIPMAVGFALFIPQFYVDAPLRIGHGVLIGFGCAVVALGVLRSQSPRSTMTGA